MDVRSIVIQEIADPFRGHRERCQLVLPVQVSGLDIHVPQLATTAPKRQFQAFLALANGQGSQIAPSPPGTYAPTHQQGKQDRSGQIGQARQRRLPWRGLHANIQHGFLAEFDIALVTRPQAQSVRSAGQVGVGGYATRCRCFDPVGIVAIEQVAVTDGFGIDEIQGGKLERNIVIVVSQVNQAALPDSAVEG